MTRSSHNNYKTGEITSAGTLICDQCGGILHFYKAGKYPPAPAAMQPRFTVNRFICNRR
jgi:hypothetical protein